MFKGLFGVAFFLKGGWDSHKQVVTSELSDPNFAGEHLTFLGGIKKRFKKCLMDFL
jgi:hypothetical protein